MKNDLLSLSNEKFLLLKETKRLFIYSDIYVYDNFPKSKKHLKIIYFDEINELLNNIILANSSENNIRKKHQNNALLNLSMLDFLITYFYDLNIITKKRYVSAVRIMINIKKLLNGWINETSI